MKAYLVASILICQTLACKLSLPQGLQEKEIVLNFALAYARMHLEKDLGKVLLYLSKISY